MAFTPDVEQRAMLERLSRLRTDQRKPTADDNDEEVLDMRKLMEKKFSGTVFDPTKTFHHCSQGMQYVKLRGRRKSREFEDLLMHTSTGKLNFSNPSKRNLHRTNSISKHHSESAENIAISSPRQPPKSAAEQSSHQPHFRTTPPGGQTNKGGNAVPVINHTVTSLKRMNSNEIKRKALQRSNSQPLSADRRIRKISSDNSNPSSAKPQTRVTRLKSDSK